MARKSGQGPQAIRERAAKTAAAMGTPSAAAQAKKKPSLAQSIAAIPRFIREVRAEARKITWTSRRETWITSVMVAIMVALAALFFWAVNSIISIGITWILKVASGG